jgi:hypothetical protein
MSSLPQAVSTEAEMMARYGTGHGDGVEEALQRIHVTGGTTGILVDALRTYRPYTPSFIGRAEDQAYLLSVLFQDPTPNLRYVHKDGLIMRHDKEAFAGEAIQAASTGKQIGDYVRILLFSSYCRWLPWPFEKTKQLIDPFTGCFVSEIPFTVVLLRFALKAATLFQKGREDEANDLLEKGIPRISETIEKLRAAGEPLKERVRREKDGWNLYYDTLDRVEEAYKEGDPSASALVEKARDVVRACALTV